MPFSLAAGSGITIAISVRRKRFRIVSESVSWVGGGERGSCQGTGDQT